jgi:hypothetical protein
MKNEIVVDPSVMLADDYNKDPVASYQKLIKHYNLDGQQEMTWRAVTRVFTMAYQIGQWANKKPIDRSVLMGGSWEYWIRPTNPEISLKRQDIVLFLKEITDDMLVTAMTNRIRLLNNWIWNQQYPTFTLTYAKKDKELKTYMCVENFCELYKLYIQRSLHTIEEFIINGPSEEGFRCYDPDTDYFKDIFVPHVYLEHFGKSDWDMFCANPFLCAHYDDHAGDIRIDSLDYYEAMMVRGLRKSVGHLTTPRDFPGC